jgi:integrase
MATIRKRGDRFQAIVKRRGFPLTSQTFEHKADALIWARQIESEIDRGQYLPRAVSEGLLLRDLIERYRHDVLPTKRGKHFAPALRLLDERFGRYAVSALSSRRIAEFRDQRLRSGHAASTVRKELNLLSRIFDLAMREWDVVLPANPCKAVSRPPERNARTRRLRQHEEDYLLTKARPEVAQIVRMALETSARLGELLSLEWADVDTDTRVAYTYGVNRQGTKNGTPLRAIPLSLKAIELLESLPHSDRRVFPTWAASDSFNKAWRTAISDATQAYAKDCKKNGSKPDPAFLTDLVFHDLRHEATSRLFEKRKLDSMEIAMITGHKSLAMLKRYTHLRASELAKQLD